MNQDPQSTYYIKPNPMHKRSYQIFRRAHGDMTHDQPIGEYTVVDKDEAAHITEEKMKALSAILNGKEPVLPDLANNTVAEMQSAQDSGDGENDVPPNERAENAENAPAKIPQSVAFQRVGAQSENDLTEKTIFYNIKKGSHGQTQRDVNAILTLAKQETVKQSA